MAKKKSKNNYLNVFLVFFIVASVAAIVYVLSVQEQKPGFGEQKRQPKVSSQPQKQIKPQTQHVIPEQKKEKQKAIVSKIEKMPLPKKQIAIIIDDIGYDLEPVKELLKIDADITFSILPFLAYSRESAIMLRREKREILLHLPMEPVSYPKDKPGEGALFTDMNNKELLYQLEKNIESLPYIAGVNKHMGSKFMLEREKLELIFGQLKKKNLFFIDSRTAVNSEAVAAAKAVGLSIGERKIFIDNNRDYNQIYSSLMSVVNYNSNSYPLIVIGHPYPETIRAIKDAAKVLREKGILIVPVSQVMKTKSPQGVS